MITVDIQNVTECLAVLQKAKDKSADLSPVFRTIVDPDLTELFRKRFATGGEGTWPALDSRTLKEKERLNRGLMGTLRRYDRLWSSFVSENSPDAVHLVSKLRFERGSAVPYAEMHQEGGDTIPERQIIPDPFPANITTKWAEQIADYLEKL